MDEQKIDRIHTALKSEERKKVNLKVLVKEVKIEEMVSQEEEKQQLEENSIHKVLKQRGED